MTAFDSVLKCPSIPQSCFQKKLIIENDWLWFLAEMYTNNSAMLSKATYYWEWLALNLCWNVCCSSMLKKCLFDAVLLYAFNTNDSFWQCFQTQILENVWFLQVCTEDVSTVTFVESITYYYQSIMSIKLSMSRDLSLISLIEKGIVSSWDWAEYCLSSMCDACLS